MDTEKCKVLLHVVESGNIRATASQLGYTPSGASRMMASLEAELGVTLLQRSRKGVRPTQACERLLPAFRRLVQAASACSQQAHAICGLEEGEVRIGIAYPQFYAALTSALRGFSMEHPGIRFSVREQNSTPLAAQLEEGRLDFAIISKREGSFAWHELARDKLVALVPEGHALAHAKAYPLKRFAEDPFIEIGPGEHTDNYLAFSRYGIEPNTCFSVSLDSAGYEMVEAGLGVTLTNAIHAQCRIGEAHVRVLPTEPSVEVSIGAAWTPDDAASPAARAFAAFALPFMLEQE